MSSLVMKLLPIAMVTIAVAYATKIVSNKSLFNTGTVVKDVSTCATASEASRESIEKMSREKDRGLLVSLVSALLLNIIGALLNQIGVQEGYIVLNYGFILGPVIGYMLDIGIATDDGVLAMGRGDGVSYVFSSLASPKFFRYILTVFLDMFISNPLQDSIKHYLRRVRGGITGNALGYGQLVKSNFPSMLQSIVGVLTFQAYTNDTRFRWAYATSDSMNRIPNTSIMLATSVAAALFVAYTVPGAESIDRRVPFALISIILLSIGNVIEFTKCNGQKVNMFDADDNDIGIDEPQRVILGGIMFTAFIIVGLVIPIVYIK